MSMRWRLKVNAMLGQPSRRNESLSHHLNYREPVPNGYGFNSKPSVLNEP